MNTIAIAIKLNERQVLIGATWPTIETLKALAQYKLARLKRKAQQVAFDLAMAIIPMPQVGAVA